MLRRTAAPLLTVLALLLALGGACSGDDGDAATDTSAAAVEQGTADEAPTGECDVIQVLLKLDVTDEQVSEVEETLDGIDGVTHELAEAAAETEPSMILVKADNDAAADAVGEELSGDPAVVSVVFPEQLC